MIAKSKKYGTKLQPMELTVESSRGSAPNRFSPNSPSRFPLTWRQLHTTLQTPNPLPQGRATSPIYKTAMVVNKDSQFASDMNNDS